LDGDAGNAISGTEVAFLFACDPGLSLEVIGVFEALFNLERNFFDRVSEVQRSLKFKPTVLISGLALLNDFLETEPITIIDNGS
jgi:hypothetical protein